MTEPAYQQTLYPLILALSVALFLHVALATLVSGWLSLPDPESPEQTVRVRLAAAGANPSDSSAQAPPRTSTPDSGTPPEPREASAPPAGATTAGDTKRPREATRTEVGTNSPPREETAAEPDRSTATPQPALAPGTDSPIPGADTDTPITRLSRNETHQRSDYEIALWEKIAGQIEYTPMIAEMDKPRDVILDLRLMANGALRRARIEASSGIDELDRVAREAALAATPFPEPPESQHRFSVRLIFEPGAR